MIGSGCFCVSVAMKAFSERSLILKQSGRIVYSEKKFSFLDFFVHVLCDFWDVQFSFYKFCKYLPDIIDIVVDLSA